MKRGFARQALAFISVICISGISNSVALAAAPPPPPGDLNWMPVEPTPRPIRPDFRTGGEPSPSVECNLNRSHIDCIRLCERNPRLPWCDTYGRGGDNGNGNGGGSRPYPPTDPNRPIITPAYQLPAEYDCPLFENRPHEALNQAIESLSYAMTTVPECVAQRETMESVQMNNTAVRDAIKLLQEFMLNPEQANSGNLGQMEQSVRVAIQAVTNLSQILGSNTLLQSRCGRELMTTGKALLALNDILNNLAPYALAAVAVNPAIGVAAKFAISGGAVATSAISTMVKMSEQGTVDMNNPEHRKAVLKNTCAYSKVARKVRFMQLAQSGHVQKLDKELEQYMTAFRLRYERKVRGLDEVIEYKESIEKIAGGIELQMRKDLFELGAIDMQLKEASGDDQYACLIGAELVRRSQLTDNNRYYGVFPTTISLNLDQAVLLAQVDPMSMPIVTVKRLNDVSRQRILALEPAALRDDGAAIKLCADTTRSWVKGLRQMIKVTAEVVNVERAEVERDLEQNPDYAGWREQYRRVKEEQQTVNRVARVMRELARDNSVIDRSELDQRMSGLKTALFGTNGRWSWGHSPVQEWINHTGRLHANRISSFSQNIANLQTAAYELSNAKTIAQNATLSAARREALLAAENRSAGTLDQITIDRVKPGTRGHEVTCQLLESAWLDWASSIDHLNATQFMCDMIDAYLDNKVENGLVAYCRGKISLDGRQLTPSGLQTSRTRLVTEKRAALLTYEQWATKVAHKMTQIQCPLPPVSVMN